MADRKHSASAQNLQRLIDRQETDEADQQPVGDVMTSPAQKDDTPRHRSEADAERERQERAHYEKMRNIHSKVQSQL